MLSAPEDYGLTPEQTLAHRFETPPPDGFDAFWRRFDDALIEEPPRRLSGDAMPGDHDWVFTSARDARIVGRWHQPVAAPVAVVVTSHGSGVTSAAFEEESPAWAGHGLAVFRIRVRGFPPSVHEMHEPRESWILDGIDDPQAWVLGGAIADLVNAVRIVRAATGGRVPVALHGESFGGGLAVLAAARLAALDMAPERVAVGLPTFGAWRWRLPRYCNGMGGQVNMLHDAYRGDARERLEATLSLFDAALHARAVAVPLLAKLAIADDVVPAPTAAAIYNAWSGERHRYVVRYGHYDGGLANARRHLHFERVVPAFLDLTKSVERALEPFIHNMELT